MLLVTLAAVAGAGTGCESKERNASEEVFQSGGADMNDRLEDYAEESPAEEAPLAEPDGPAPDPAPTGEPMDP
jgi:hypothetical protein